MVAGRALELRVVDPLLGLRAAQRAAELIEEHGEPVGQLVLAGGRRVSGGHPSARPSQQRFAMRCQKASEHDGTLVPEWTSATCERLVTRA
ncbi:MAG TPA: hypothetical protein VER96_17325 [Polyangiaceae bacterium]|nr:hypothetical protein [Polyangiaceae bacterium]